MRAAVPSVRRAGTCVTALLLALSILLWPGGPASAHTDSGANSLRVIHTQWVNPRLENVTVTTPALVGPVHVDVLVPVGYSRHPTRRYPVIYFLNGGTPGPDTGLEYEQWTADGEAQQIIGNDPVIAVFPEGGSGGWYTNWYNAGKGGPPEWETFHVHELVPYIDSHYRTIADRNGRALVGLSMGGYGSMEYAARYPQIFGTAAAFSGAVDIADPASIAAEAEVVIGVMAVGAGGTADGPFGSPTADQPVWDAHDPAHLAARLVHTHLLLYCGNGDPGPLDTPSTVSSFSQGIERLVYLSNLEFEQVLSRLRIHAYVDNYGPGTHSWPYWQRDLRDALPMIMKDLATR